MHVKWYDDLSWFPGSQSSTTIEAFSGLLRYSADLEKSVDDLGNRNNGTEHFMTRKTRSSVADYLSVTQYCIDQAGSG